MGTITNCASSASVLGNEGIGGLLGYNRSELLLGYGGSITTSYSTGTVSGSRQVGDLVGNTWHGAIINCYSTASVSGTMGVGGLVGDNWGTITNCYASGSVSGNELEGLVVVGLGGLVGIGLGGVTDSFWDIQTSGQKWSFEGTGKTTTEMQTASTFIEAGWDFVDETDNGTEDVWWILEGQDYPRLWWQLEVAVVEQVSLPLRGESGEMILGLGTLEAAVYSPGGKYIATVGSLGVFLWDAETGALVRTFRGHTSRVWSVAFSPDGTRVLTGSLDGTARIWQLLQPVPPQPPGPF